MSAIEEEKMSTTRTVDGNIYDDDTGEMVGIVDAPELTEEMPDGSKRDMADWVGKRRQYHLAKIAGLRSEWDNHLKHHMEVYTPQIKEHEEAIQWIELRYKNTLYPFGLALCEQLKKKTVQIGQLILKFTKSKASTAVKDPEKAIQWARTACPDAIKTIVSATGKKGLMLENGAKKLEATIKQEVLVSAIPEELKMLLRAEEDGLEYNKGGIEEMKYE